MKKLLFVMSCMSLSISFTSCTADEIKETPPSTNSTNPITKTISADGIVHNPIDKTHG